LFLKKLFNILVSGGFYNETRKNLDLVIEKNHTQSEYFSASVGLGGDTLDGLAMWCAILLVAVLLVLSIPTSIALWNLWQSNRNFDGLILVPFMCGLILFKTRDEFSSVKPKAIKKYICILPATLAAMVVTSNCGLSRISGILLVSNLLIVFLSIFGLANRKLFVGPFILLILMIPPPQSAIDFLTVNLQRFFSIFMETVLYGFSDHFVKREGFAFWFSDLDYSMVIGPECSGLRSLLGLTIMSSFFVVFHRHKIFTAAFLLLAGVITALMLNFARVLATMQLRINKLEEYASGSWHSVLGALVFMIGCVILIRFSRFLKSADLKSRRENK
jgi:exosortase